MSRRRRESTSAMPAASAGLMRFFQDEAHGIKVKPEFVVAGSIFFILAIIIAHALFPRLLL